MENEENSNPLPSDAEQYSENENRVELDSQDGSDDDDLTDDFSATKVAAGSTSSSTPAINFLAPNSQDSNLNPSDDETEDLASQPPIEENNLNIDSQVQEENSASINRVRELELVNNKNQNLISLQSEKIVSINGLSQMRRDENERLLEQIDNLQNQLTAALRREKSLGIELEKVSGTDVEAKLQRSRLIEVNQVLQKEKEKNSELLLRKDEEILSLKGKLQNQELKQSEIIQANSTKISFFESQIKQHEDYQEKTMKTVKELNSKLISLEHEKLEVQNNLANFKKSHENIIQLHESNITSQQDQISSLTQELNERRNEVNELTSKFELRVRIYETNLNVRLEEAKKSSLIEVQKLTDELSRTQNQLESANKTILSFGSGGQESFSASVIARGGKSNISTMVSELVNLKSQRVRDEKEIKSLNQAITNLIHESKEKEPLIEELKQEYDALLSTFDTVNDKYEASCAKLSELKVEVKILAQQNQLEIDKNNSLTMKNGDLSRQIVALLEQKPNQRESSFFGTDGNGALGSLFQTTTESSSNEDLISENLLEFRNVKELQERNIELLQTVRQLTHELETSEKVFEEAKGDNSLETKFVELSKQFKDIQEQRTRQEELILNLNKQRDLYKSLMVANNPQLGDNSQQLDKHMKSNTITREKYDKLLEEHEEFREKAQLSESKLNELCTSLRNEIFEASKKVALFEAENKYLKQQHESLKKRMEFESSETKKQKASLENLERATSQLEVLLEQKKGEVLAIEVREKQLAKDMQNTNVENRLLKQESSQLRSLLGDVKQQRDEQKRLLDSFNTIKVNLKNEHERTVRALEQNIEDLRIKVEDSNRVLLQTKSDCELEITRWKQSSDESEAKVGDLQRKVDVSNDELSRQSAEILSLNAREEALQKQLIEANKVAQQVRLIKLDHARNKLDVQRAAENEFGSVEVELDPEKTKQLILRIEELKNELINKDEALNTFKAIAESAETALNDFKEAEERQRMELEKQINNLESKSEMAMKNIEKQKSILLEREKEAEEKATTIVSLREEIKTKQQSLETLQELYDQTKKNIADGLDDDGSFEVKYGREVKLHAETVTRLEGVRLQLKDVKATKLKAESELSSLKLLSKKGLEQVEIEKASLNRQNNDLRIESLEYQRQTELLSQQVKSLSKQLRAFQEEQVGGEKVASTPLDNKAEVVRLRELLQIANDHKSSADLSRTQIENELERIKEELNQSRTKSETFKVSLETLREKQSSSILMSKEENARLLSAVDENLVLRNLNAHLTKRVKEMETAVSSIGAKEEELAEKMKEICSKEKEISVVGTQNKLIEEGLRKEIAMYKSRHQSLMQRFGEKVDAETHKEVVKEVEEVKKERSVLKQKLEVLKKQLSQLESSASEGDVSALENKLQETEVMRNKLRDAARKYRDNYRVSEQQRKELEKKLKEYESKEKISKEPIVLISDEKPAVEKKPEEERVVGHKRDLKETVNLSSEEKAIEPENKKMKPTQTPTKEAKTAVSGKKKLMLNRAQLLKAKLAKQRKELQKRKQKQQEENSKEKKEDG